MPVVQLTPLFLKTLAPQPGKARTEWCDLGCKGMYLEARATSPGIGTYYLRYKDAGGTTRHLRLGTTETITLPEARLAATAKKAEIRLGSNPSLERQQQKQIPTFKQFVIEQYLPFKKSRNRSYATDVQRFNCRIFKAAFSDKRLDRITTKELIDFHSELREVHKLAPATADLHIKLLRHVFNIAWIQTPSA